jgi:hypothetical protein
MHREISLKGRFMDTNGMIVSICLALSLSGGCSTAARADRPDAIAARLGYQGCRLSKPLTLSQVMAKDMSGGTEASRAHPDWDELLNQYASGDQVYFVDCRKGDSSSIATGTSLYALVRNGVVIARVSDTAENR